MTDKLFITDFNDKNKIFFRKCIEIEILGRKYLKGLAAFSDILNEEFNCYFYHPDHLGSSSWITYTNGSAVQHLHYLPFGEEFVNQRLNDFDGVRYTFSGKEKDTETGYSYFGSRYYSSDLSIWLSVDPQADKYPSLSPYVYCANNPVRLVDPNGEDWYEKDGEMHYTTEHTSQKAFKESGIEGEYKGKTYTKDGTYYSLFGDKIKANSLKGKLTIKIDEAFDKYANYLKKCEQTEGTYPEYQSSDYTNFNDIISYNDKFGTTYENVHDEDPKTGATLRYAYGSTIRFTVTGTRDKMFGRFRGFSTGNSQTTFGSGMLAKTGYNVYIVNGKNKIVGLTFSGEKNFNAFRNHFNKLYGLK